MKSTKNNKKTKRIIVFSAACVLLIATLVVLLWRGNWLGAPGNSEQPQMQLPDATEPTTGQKNGDNVWQFSTGTIDTPYLTLYYDSGLADRLVVVQDQGPPYRLEFYAMLEGKAELRLFDMTFGEGADGNLGAIEIRGETIPVSMTIYAFTPDERWSQDEINTILAMQDEANVLIEQLQEYQVKNDYPGPFFSTDVPESGITNLSYVETPYCMLSYPAVWQDYFRIEQEAADTHSVLFYGQVEGYDPVLLFTIVFGGDAGEQVGTITDSQGRQISVNVISEVPDLHGWLDEDVNIIYEMQESINLIIESIPLQ